MNLSVTSRKVAGLTLLPLLLVPAITIVRLRGAPAAPKRPASAQTLKSHPVRPTGGQSAQGPFSLVAVTHLSQRYGFLTPPAVVIPKFMGGHMTNASIPNEPVMASCEGMGLWITAQDGVGYRVLTVPSDHQRHIYPFGHSVLVVDETLPSGYSVGWAGADGHSSLPEGRRSYEASAVLTTNSPGHPQELQVTLTPNSLALPFAVTAQPLSAKGEPLGRPLPLVCQVVNRTTVFAQIPVGYNAATQQFQVTVTRRNAVDREASWRLKSLPPSVRNGDNSQPPIVTTQAGPVTLRAAAAESEDLSGAPDFWNRHPERDAKDGWTYDEPSNADGHGWTGIPSIRFLLTAHNASHDFYQQDWAVRVNRVTPQWSSSIPLPKLSTLMPFSVFPVYNPQNLPPNESWVTHDWQVGAAYPGQQHWVEIEGDMIRSRHRAETVTFHDADIVHDPGFGGDRVIWQHPETETTPSGISVTVLNARPGIRDQSTAPVYAPNWRFDSGSAEVLLAWYLPPGILSQEHAPLDAAQEAAPPQASGLLKSEWDSSHPLVNTPVLVLPGGDSAAALLKSSSSQFRLIVSSTVPPDYSHLPRREGLFQVPPTPLPRHFKTVTFQVWLKEILEVHPFRLLVPVRVSFPPGWNPDGADSRSKAFIAQGKH